jgi:hypothetical protein
MVRTYASHGGGTLEIGTAGRMSALQLGKRPQWTKLGYRLLNKKYVDVPGCPALFRDADSSPKKSDYQPDRNWVVLDNGLESNRRLMDETSECLS